MEDPSDAVVGDTILRESTVSAFMSVDPEAGPDDTLREAIEDHERIVEESMGLNNPWNCEKEETGHQSRVEEVATKVEQRLRQGGLEAVGWDRITQFFDTDIALHDLLAFSINVYNSCATHSSRNPSHLGRMAFVNGSKSSLVRLNLERDASFERRLAICHIGRVEFNHMCESLGSHGRSKVCEHKGVEHEYYHSYDWKCGVFIQQFCLQASDVNQSVNSHYDDSLHR